MDGRGTVVNVTNDGRLLVTIITVGNCLSQRG